MRSREPCLLRITYSTNHYYLSTFQGRGKRKCIEAFKIVENSLLHVKDTPSRIHTSVEGEEVSWQLWIQNLALIYHSKHGIPFSETKTFIIFDQVQDRRQTSTVCASQIEPTEGIWHPTELGLMSTWHLPVITDEYLFRESNVAWLAMSISWKNVRINGTSFHFGEKVRVHEYHLPSSVTHCKSIDDFDPNNTGKIPRTGTPNAPFGISSATGGDILDHAELVFAWALWTFKSLPWSTSSRKCAPASHQHPQGHTFARTCESCRFGIIFARYTGSDTFSRLLLWEDTKNNHIWSVSW